MTGGFIDTFISPGPDGGPNSDGLDGPHMFIFGPDEDLYIASPLSNLILRYDGDTGAFANAFTTEELVGPQGLAFGPDGNLYVTSFNNSAVLRFDPSTGLFTDVFVPAGGGGLEFPGYLTFHDVPCDIPVGGIAEVLVDGSDSPASPADGSGSSAPPYAAIAGGLAAVVAVAAGGWYARRRWLR